MSLHRPELRLDETPGLLAKCPRLGVVHVNQIDEPPFRRDEQAGCLLAGVQVHDNAAHHTFWIGGTHAAPDLGICAQVQGQIEHSVLEILDARQVGDRTAIVNRYSHGRMLAVRHALCQGRSYGFFDPSRAKRGREWSGVFFELDILRFSYTTSLSSAKFEKDSRPLRWLQ